MFFRQIYDASLAQNAYLIGCQRTGQALLIDPERDIDRYLAIAEENDLTITHVTETHIHADFVSGSREILETQEGVTAWLSDMGDTDWKYVWAQGRKDVRLLKDGDSFKVGNIVITAVHTPGHTPEHLSFLIEDQGGGADEPMGIVTGDFVFVGDVGRPDLLETAAGVEGVREPSARKLFESIQKFRKLDDFVQVLPGHGAGSACGKALGAMPVSTVGYEKRFNGALRTAFNQGEEAFVESILEGQPEPPVYFARMKRVNKEGPDVLGALPVPSRVSVGEVARVLENKKVVLLDLRRDRQAFMERHVKGSLYAPLGGKFTSVAGSYVEPESEIVLAVESPEDLEEAVRGLVRIGLDHVIGYVVLGEVLSEERARPMIVSTESASTTDIDDLLEAHPGSVVLDVRGAGEYAEGHVPGAIHVAYTRLSQNLDEIPRGGKVIVHCGSGLRASFAVPYLERAGFDVIYGDGPIRDWHEMQRRKAPVMATV